MIQQASTRFMISSSAFEMNGMIPERFTCDGANIPPKLIFTNVPDGTVSLALIMEDIDVPPSIKSDGIWDHWVLWNIPPEVTFVDANSSLGVLGTNTGGETGYYGPCPPSGEHRYIFTLYALDSTLSLLPHSTKKDLLSNLAPHLIGKAELIGRYSRNMT